MISKIKTVAAKLPGQTLRKDLARSFVPPLASFIRLGLRLCVISLLYVAGFHQIALVLAVMSVMILIGPIEGQIAKSIAKSLPRARAHFQKRRHRR